MKFTSLIKMFFVFLLLSCNRHSDISDDVMIFCYNEPANITSLDPAYARSMANIWGVNQVFNGLVQLDDSLRIVPCIAESWDVSPDGLVYTFYLRDDVCFHPDSSISDRKSVV